MAKQYCRFRQFRSFTQFTDQCRFTRSCNESGFFLSSHTFDDDVALRQRAKSIDTKGVGTKSFFIKNDRPNMLSMREDRPRVWASLCSGKGAIPCRRLCFFEKVVQFGVDSVLKSCCF